MFLHVFAPPFKRSFSIFTGIQGSFCPGHVTSVVLIRSMLPLPLLLSNQFPPSWRSSTPRLCHLLWPPWQRRCMSPVFAPTSQFSQARICADALTFGKAVKSVPARNCCGLLPALSTRRGQTLRGCVLQVTLLEGKRPVLWGFLINRYKNCFIFLFFGFFFLKFCFLDLRNALLTRNKVKSKAIQCKC